jgi:general stress protein YciG
MKQEPEKGSMSVREAGRKGGNTTKARYGEEYYEAIGKKGGQKVRELIARGKAAMKHEHKEP